MIWLLPLAWADPVADPPEPEPPPTETQPESTEAHVDEILVQLEAAPSHTKRREVLTSALEAHPDMAAEIGAMLAVVGSLEATDRNDPSIVRMFLRAAANGDPQVRAMAITRAAEGGDPPTGAAPTPVPAPMPVVAPEPVVSPPDLSKFRDYKRGRLVRDSWQYSQTITTGTPVATGATTSATIWSSSTRHISTWGIYEGGGGLVPPEVFAPVVGDGAAVDSLHRARGRYNAAWVTAIVGGAALFGSVLSVATRESGTDYFGMDGNSLAVFGVGAGASIATLILTGTSRGRLKFPAKTWTPNEADRLVERHNALLRSELGLTEADTAEIDGLGYQPP